jgi:glycosyltransferase involved in cell wall biosynthesis/aminoglycoside phosphotransferase (APT) family kinase protein
VEVATATTSTAQAAQGASQSEPRVRTAVAVLMTRFPRIDETFILREIIELERNGQPVVVVPVLREDAPVIHEEAKPWVKRALYTPFVSRDILASNFRALVKSPARYLRVLFSLIFGMMLRPSTLVRSLAIFPKAVYLAEVLPAKGVRHMHAHFASHATTLAWLISSLSDLTYSFTVHGPDVFVHRVLLAEKIRKATFIRCISTFNKAFLAGLYPGITDGKLEVVHSGLNPDVYDEAARRAPRAKKRPRLLSVAALNPRHGYPLLIDACASLIRTGAEVECCIVGDGPMRTVTEEWIAKHGLSDHVRILGNLPQHEVARLMGETDIFVAPNVIATDGMMEGLPVSLMEAMAAGKPVVAAAISGIPELVQDEVNGILVDAAYAERLADAVRRLLADPQLRERMGRNGQKKVRAEFDVRKTTRGVIALLDRQRTSQETTAAQRIASLNWARLGAVAVGVRRIHEREEGIVAEVAISDGVSRRDVIVRQARRDSAYSERPRREFEMLSVLRQSMEARRAEETGGIVYSVPKLLMFDEPHGAVVVDRADGKALSGMIAETRSRSGLRRLGVALRKTGWWLRAMQDQTHSDEDARHVRTAVTYLALRDLDLAAAADRRIARMREQIAMRMRTLESRLAERPTPVVGQHGDFRPDNIFIGDHRVEVIDFGCYREGLPFEDVAQLLIHLELRFHGPLSRRNLPMLRRELLDGYIGGMSGGVGSGLRAERDDAMQLFSITKALHMLAHEGDDATFAGRRRRRILRRIITRNL